MAILPVGIGSAEEGGYQIERSLRFNSADSAYLNRTPASAGNLDAWTFSAWVKRSKIGISTTIFSAQSDTNNWMYIGFLSGDTLTWQQADSGSVTMTLTTSQLFRDVGSWYHIVCKYDSAQATAADRQEIYINGIKVTAFGTATRLGLNVDSRINRNIAHQIGRYISAANYFNGYMTEINFIDGSTPATTTRVVNGVTQTILTEFGEFNEDTGVWQPIEYTGTYGTNGFYLNFSDNSGTTSTTLGKDQAGSNNWTPNNFSVTAGAGNDSLVDSPTNYGTDTGVGGEVRGNYATWNPLASPTSAPTNGNLEVVNSSGTKKVTIAFPLSGKWYWEQLAGSNSIIGICNADAPTSTSVFYLNSRTAAYYNNGTLYRTPEGNTGSWGATYTSGDIVAGAIDFDASPPTLKFYKNGVQQGSTLNLTTGIQYTIATGIGGVGVETLNCGQRPFAYTAPSGFKALCTQNLPEPTIVDGGEYFDVDVYTGIAGTYTKSGLDFQPDFIWGKARNAAAAHRLVDAVRGGTLKLTTSSTDAENTDVAPYTFTSDGYSIPGGVNHNNSNGTTYVAWLWKANGAGVSNTDGSITSTVSANTTSGISICTYTGTGANATVGHGLGVAPSMIILKPRNSADNWPVWHSSFAVNEYVYLNLTVAKTSLSTFMNSTLPSSTVISLGTWANTNTNAQTMVAYCFAAIPGSFSAMGSYLGNGSADGPFVFLNFRPAWIMIKNVEQAGGQWFIYDDARETYNPNNSSLFAESLQAETANNSALDIDFLSNGWKIRNTGSGFNNSGIKYIYMAFAENPFKYSLAR
jgi:hypothetical protein